MGAAPCRYGGVYQSVNAKVATPMTQFTARKAHTYSDPSNFKPVNFGGRNFGESLPWALSKPRELIGVYTSQPNWVVITGPWIKLIGWKRYFPLNMTHFSWTSPIKWPLTDRVCITDVYLVKKSKNKVLVDILDKPTVTAGARWWTDAEEKPSPGWSWVAVEGGSWGTCPQATKRRP